MIPIIILVTSALTHFFHFGFPHEVVFDEVHNGFYVSQYWSGSFWFDVHPPLGRLLIAWAGYILNINPAVNTGAIGNALPESWVLLRLLPLVLGTLLPLIIYGICRRLGFGRFASGVAALLVILENSLLVQSRLILTDIILLFFGFLSLYLYLEFRLNWQKHPRRSRIILILFSAISAAAALSVKWTGASFMGLIILLEIFIQFGRSQSRELALKRFFKLVATLVVVGGSFYFAVFAVNFKLLPYSGSGNDYLSPEFQKSLIANRYADDPGVKPAGLLQRFIENNVAIFEYTSTLNTPHDYSSRWYTWPVMQRPIYYWDGKNGTGYIYYLGNPFIYWLGSATILVLLLYWLRGVLRPGFRTSVESLRLNFVVLGYLANFLPFILIGRVMFLYHYEAALLFSILAIAYALDRIQIRRRQAFVGGLILVVATVVFVYFAPLSYGLPLSESQLESRMWLPTWR